MVWWPKPRITGLRKWVIIVDTYLNSLFPFYNLTLCTPYSQWQQLEYTCIHGIGVIRVISTYLNFIDDADDAEDAGADDADVAPRGGIEPRQKERVSHPRG